LAVTEADLTEHSWKESSQHAKKDRALEKARTRSFHDLRILFVLLRSLNEGSRRSLQRRDDADAADHIVISMLVTAVNPVDS
jgi:hypothetical protein